MLSKSSFMPWPIKKLEEVCEIISPGIEKFDGAKKYVATADVDFNKIVNFKEITYNNRPSRANIETKENNVLVARMAETKKFLVVDKKLQDNFIFSTGFAALRTKKDLLPKYLFYFLTTKDFNLQKDKLAVGATQKAINNPALKRIKIPLPPLKIQRKIVERLDAIKKAQESNDKQIELADELFQSLLEKELESKGKDWEVQKLEALLKLSSGKFISNIERIEKGAYPIYGGNGILGHTDKFLVDYSTVVIGRVGVYCGSIHFAPPKSWVTDNAIYVKEISRKLKIEFLYYVLLRSNLNRFAAPSGQPKITQAPILNLKITLPPLSTQHQIVTKLQAVQDYKKKLLEQKQKLQELFESCLDKAMKGELIG